jgi:hypothetical protein
MNDHDDDCVEDDAPHWVALAEADYIARKLGTMEMVASRYDVPVGTVYRVAAQRQWTKRRTAAEAEAARRLDEEATELIVGVYSDIRHVTGQAAQRAAHILARHMSQELRRQADAQQVGDAYVPVAPPRGFAEIIKVAIALAPKLPEHSPGAGAAMDADEVVRRLKELDAGPQLSDAGADDFDPDAELARLRGGES